jgi:hypothetical protein
LKRRIFKRKGLSKKPELNNPGSGVGKVATDQRPKADIKI